MSKNIIVITGSPRSGGNSEILADAFIEGAEKSGNTVIRFNAGRMNIRGCLDCKYCFTHDGKCLQKDDMQEIYPALRQTDILVLASPVYWYGLTSQIKSVIDRMFAGSRKPFAITSMVLLAAYGDSDSNVFSPAEAHFRAIAHYMEWAVIGIIAEGNVHEAGEIRGRKALLDAFELGESIR